MDAAKASLKKHMSKSGQHDTTIHESVAPAVQRETVSRTQHENQSTAVDREVHQDHHHTTEQPINHSEVLPETHHHNAVPVEHRTFEHHDPEKLQRSLDAEKGQYRDTQTRVEGEKTRSEAPMVQGEHVHHHVHETIQPVVHKQTVEPHVVHTTVPIHEVHHNQAQHHAASTLAPVSMDDFKKQGGSLGGHEAETSFAHGEPRSLHGRDVRDAAGTANGANTDSRTTNATAERMGTDNRTTNATSMESGAHTSNHADRDGYGYSQGQNPATKAAQTASSRSGERAGTDGGLPGSENQSSSQGLSSGAATSAAKKPSLMDKINPKVDSSGDGVAGFMK